MSIEAMKMAIEALESAKNNHGKLLLSDPPQEAWRFHRVDDAVSASITALRQAIEQEEQAHAIDTSQERVDEIVKTEHDKQIEIAQAYERGWNAALAQQEPVACIGTNGELMWLNKPKVIYSKPIPLYTAPPQRKPLTDERVWDAYMQISAEFDCNVIDLVEFARAIEAAHGIGEEA